MGKRKVLRFTIFILVIFPIFFATFIKLDKQENLIISIVLFSISLFSFKFEKELFPAILFFSLIQILSPISDGLCNFFGLEFPGVYYLIPIVSFTILILLFKNIRNYISWWQKDNLDKKSVVLIIGLVVISSLSLYLWNILCPNDLSQFLKQFPDVPLLWIVINGFFFALFNAFAEEYLVRGMLCNGLESIFQNKHIIIILQALIFGISHYFGFPGGFIGVIMVFFWSIILGVLRYMAKGLKGVIIAHFFADLTIYFILYSFK